LLVLFISKTVEIFNSALQHQDRVHHANRIEAVERDDARASLQLIGVDAYNIEDDVNIDVGTVWIQANRLPNKRCRRLFMRELGRSGNRLCEALNDASIACGCDVKISVSRYGVPTVIGKKIEMNDSNQAARPLWVELRVSTQPPG